MLLLLLLHFVQDNNDVSSIRYNIIEYQNYTYDTYDTSNITRQYRTKSNL